MNKNKFMKSGHFPTLIAAFLYFDVSFMVWVLLGPLAPFLSQQLQLTPYQKGLLTAIPLLGGALFRPVLGVLGERFGERRTGLLGLTLTLVPLILGWRVAHSPEHFYFLGFLLGIAGASFAVALPIAGRWYPPKYQGLVMGIAGAGNSGTLIATLFAPRLAQRFGWNITFALAMLPVVIVLFLFALLAKDSPRWGSPPGWAEYAAVLREPDAAWFCFFYSFTFGGFVGLTSFLTIFFHDQYALSKVRAGDFTTIVVLAGSFLRPVGGWLSDKIGGYRLLMLLLAGVAGCLMGVGRLPALPLEVALLFFTMGMLGMEKVGEIAIFLQRGTVMAQRLVVIGNGMAGVACVEQILKHAPKFEITIFGDETHVNYNRILLSSVLAGEKAADDILLNGLEWYQNHGIELRLGVRITEVDAERKTVTGDDGSVTPFDKLLIATGSTPLIPPMEGVKKDGVFVFRNLDDTRALLDRAAPGKKAVVIGGGLLGLEAARGLQVQGCDVTVVHLMDTLMERQLDLTGGGYLKAKMECLGVKVLLERNTTAILGNGKAEAVAFKDGSSVEADFVVIAAGIRPNVELGRKAGLQVNRGILVNDYMETSNPDVFAVGECVEHNGICYGLVAPLFEQGKVLAATITGNRGPVYGGTIQAAKLKIMGVDVFSAGDFSEKAAGTDAIRYEDPALGTYKKLTVRDGKLAGVILVGDTSDSHRYMDWLRSATDLTALRRQLLFPSPVADAGLDTAQMPDHETVCGCLGVTKGSIIQAIHEKGVNTL